MSSSFLKNYLPLLGLLTFWMVSIALVAYPGLGASIPTVPAKVSSERIIILFTSAAAAATYSGFLGVKWLRSARS